MIKDQTLPMPAFKTPSFQDRQQTAAKARDAALNLYRNRPPVDDAVFAERAARRQAKEAAQAAKRVEAAQARQVAAEARREQERLAAIAAEVAAKAKADSEQAETDAVAKASADAKAQKVAERKNWTEEDRKAARDARYAARKARQGKGR